MGNDERKPVICRYCHKVMWRAGRKYRTGYKHFYACDCGASSPPEVAEETAYAAATRTPPNRPLTREQAIRSDLPVWVEYIDYPDESRLAFVCSGEEENTLFMTSKGSAAFNEDYNAETMLFFSEPPTLADIEAARAEKGADNEI